MKANVLHEFGGLYDIHMRDEAGNERMESSDFKDTWLEYGIGATIKTREDTYLYCDVEKSAGNDFEKDWSWNAGIRWKFN